MANESSWAEPGGGSGARHQGEGGLACATWRNSLSHSRKGRQKKREKGREQGRKEGARLRERGQTTCIHSGRIVYASVLECVAAGGDFDRCGPHVAQLCTEEGRTGGGEEHCGAAERDEAKILGVQGRASWGTRY